MVACVIYIYIYIYTHIYTYIYIYIYIYMKTHHRLKCLYVERRVQCCTLRPEVQDEGPVYGAYKTTSPINGYKFVCVSLL